MICKVLKKVSKVWRKLDWMFRVFVVASFFSAVLLSVILAAGFFYGKKLTIESALAKAEILNEWLSDKNIAALTAGNAHRFDFGRLKDVAQIAKIVVFDAEGNVFAPASLRGLRFDNPVELKKMLAKRKPSLLKENGTLRIFTPLRDISETVRGLSYIEIGVSRAFPLLPVGLVVGAVALSFGLLIFWLFRDMKMTIEDIGAPLPSCRFESLENKFNSFAEDLKFKLSGEFLTEWRQLIHAIDSPAIVLDEMLRLIDLNNQAALSFCLPSSANEGAHLIDVMPSGDFRDGLIGLLKTGERVKKIVILDGTKHVRVSICRAERGIIGFKYTIILSEEGR